MNELFDIPLDKPLPGALLDGLLFFTFFLHFFFVLLTLGTAMLGVYYYVDGRFADRQRGPRDRHFLKSFFVHNSLAIVLGVAPILLMQVGHSVPFLTAVNLMAPLWLLIVVLLVAALLLLEALAERKRQRPRLYLAMGLLGLACLVAVPGIFSATLVATENPGRWEEILSRGGAIPPELVLHWTARVLHVLGAAVVFTAAFHYVYPGRKDALRLRGGMLRWIVGGLWFQVVAGVALYASLPRFPGIPGNLLLIVGVLAAGGLAWLAFRGRERGLLVSGSATAALLMLVLLTMLLVRQRLQGPVLHAMAVELEANLARRQAALGSFGPRDGGPSADLAIYNNAPTIYLRSCEFCHGTVANGQGIDARWLAVPPEDLTALRTSDRELHAILTRGIPGTAMPRFGYYTRDELDEVIRFLREQAGMKRFPEPLPVEVSATARSSAAAVFATRCVVCHGPEGRGTPLALNFEPPPPDLTRLAYSPQRTFRVVSEGYPGTQMPAFGELPVAVRWGLVAVVRELHRAE